MDLFLIAAVIFLAVFIQSAAGFGVALVAMALLPSVVGIRVATPLVALVALTIEIFLIVRYRNELKLAAVWPLVVSALVGVPVGVLMLDKVDEEIILTILGIIIAGYALYALLEIKLPDLKHPLWAYGSGFLGGILGGAYNTSGPPVIIYGNCRQWPALEFKGNLQGFFLVTSVAVLISHLLSGNVTSIVIRDFLWAVPTIGLGFLAGTALDKYLNEVIFRKVVLILLVVMGIRLIL